MRYPIHDTSILDKDFMSYQEIEENFGRQAVLDRHFMVIKGYKTDTTKPKENQFQTHEIKCVEFDRQTAINSYLIKRNKIFGY